MKNYIDMGKTLLDTWKEYVYLDTYEYLAKSLFIRHMIHVKVKTVIARGNEVYRLIVLKVLKKDEQKFLRAMEELKGKMLLFDHRDYEAQGGMLTAMAAAL